MLVVAIPVVPLHVGLDVSAVLLIEPDASVVRLSLIPVGEPWLLSCRKQEKLLAQT